MISIPLLLIRSDLRVCMSHLSSPMIAQVQPILVAYTTVTVPAGKEWMVRGSVRYVPTQY